MNFRFNQQYIISHLASTILIITTLTAFTSINTTNAKSIDNEPTTTQIPIAPNASSSYRIRSSSTAGPVSTDTANTSSTIFFDNFQFVAATPTNASATPNAEANDSVPKILKISTIPADYTDTHSRHVGHVLSDLHRDTVSERRKVTKMRSALNEAATYGLQEMMEMFGIKEPGLIRKGNNIVISFFETCA